MAKGIFRALRVSGTCLCTDDEPRTSIGHTKRSRWVGSDDASAWSALRAIYQPNLPAKWHLMGRALQILHSARGALRLGLL